MKPAIVLLVAACVLPFSADARITYELSIKGALARVAFKVVDQDGVAVPGAKVWGGFSANSIRDSALVDGVTNTNGEFVAQGKCNEFLRVDITKDGYYRSEEKINFWRSKANPVVADGRWQPYGETRTVVLKKIRNPIRLRDPDARCRHEYPASGEWVGFDLEMSDWCPPLGHGRHSDMMVRYTHETKSGGYFKTLDVSFTNNPCAGVCLKARDSNSEMDSAYAASTNVSYTGCLRYEFERTARGNHAISGLGLGEYLVFRTRTRVDPKGNLISAHYGRLMGPWQFVDKGGMSFGPVFFNPVPNDTNLEDAETARKSRLGYLQSLEFQRKSMPGRR